MPVPGNLSGGIEPQGPSQTLEYLNTAAVHVCRYADIPVGSVTGQMLVDAGIQVFRLPTGGHNYLYWPGRLHTPMKCYNGLQAGKLITSMDGWQQAVMGTRQPTATATGAASSAAAHPPTSRPDQKPVHAVRAAAAAQDSKPPAPEADMPRKRFFRTMQTAPREPREPRTADKPQAAAAAVDEHTPKRRKRATANGLSTGAMAAGRTAAGTSAAAAGAAVSHDHQTGDAGSRHHHGSSRNSGDGVLRSVRDAATELSEAVELATSVSGWAPEVLHSLPGAAVLTAGLDQGTLELFTEAAQAMRHDLVSDQAIYEQMLDAHTTHHAAASSIKGVETAAARRKPFMMFRGALEECAADAHTWLSHAHQKRLLEKLRAMCQVKDLVDKYQEAIQQLQQVQTGVRGPKNNKRGVVASTRGEALSAPAQPHSEQQQQQQVKTPRAPPATVEEQRLAALLKQQQQQQQRLQEQQQLREKQMTEARLRETEDLQHQHHQQQQPRQVGETAGLEPSAAYMYHHTGGTESDVGVLQQQQQQQHSGDLAPQGSGGVGPGGGTVLTFLQQFMKNAPAAGGQAGSQDGASRGPDTESAAGFGPVEKDQE